MPFVNVNGKYTYVNPNKVTRTNDTGFSSYTDAPEKVQQDIAIIERTRSGRSAGRNETYGTSSYTDAPEKVQLDNAFINEQMQVIAQTREFDRQEREMLERLVETRNLSWKQANEVYQNDVSNFNKRLVDASNQRLQNLANSLSTTQAITTEQKKTFLQKVGQWFKEHPKPSQEFLDRQAAREEANEDKEKIKQVTSKPLSLWLGEKVAKIPAYQKFIENKPFLSQGIIPAFNVTIPTSKWGVMQEVKVPEGKIDFETAYLRASTVAKGMFFSPLMMTGAEAAVENAGVGYEYVTIKGRRYRKNLLTGKIEAEVPVYEVVSGTEGAYIASYGGSKYYVYPDGRFVKIKPAVKSGTSPTIFQIPSSSPAPDGLPSMVGGSGLRTPSTSGSVGGVYDVVMDINRLPSEIEIAPVITAIGGELGFKPKQQEILVTKTFKPLMITPTTIGVLKEIQGSVGGGGSKSKSTFTNSLVQPQQIIQQQGQAQSLAQSNLLRTQSLQLSALKFQQGQVSNLLQLSKLKYDGGGAGEWKGTIKPPIFFSKKKKMIDKFIGKTKSTGNIFETYVRKRKKDVLLGKFENIGAAKKKLVGELKGTLAASGFISTKKKRIPVSKLNLGFEFTQGKRDASRVVQKRGFRLGTQSEVSEILRAKRGKNVKWL